MVWPPTPGMALSRTASSVGTRIEGPSTFGSLESEMVRALSSVKVVESNSPLEEISTELRSAESRTASKAKKKRNKAEAAAIGVKVPL